MRYILKLYRFKPTTFMLYALRWLNVRKRRELNMPDFIRKTKIRKAPEKQKKEGNIIVFRKNSVNFVKHNSS